jgi:hypothetical protein
MRRMWFPGTGPARPASPGRHLRPIRAHHGQRIPTTSRSRCARRRRGAPPHIRPGDGAGRAARGGAGGHAVNRPAAAPTVANSGREVFGHLPTGVTVIAARDDRRKDVARRRWTRRGRGGRHLRLCPSIPRWSVWRAVTPPNGSSADLVGESGLVVNGCIAWAQCRISEVMAAGDHSIVVASASARQLARPEARPLVFYRCAYHRPLQVEYLPAPGWCELVGQRPPPPRVGRCPPRAPWPPRRVP